MVFPLIAAAIMGGATLVGGVVNAKATNKATNAATAANEANTQLNRETYQQTRADLAPYNQGGQAAYSALQQRMGLAPAAKPAGGLAGVSPMERGAGTGSEGGQISGATGPQPQGAPDFAAYLAANPDITANGWLQEHPPASVGDLNGDGQVTTADSAAAHWNEYGQNEHRDLPTTQLQAPGEMAPPAVQTDTGLMTAARPAPTAAPTFGDAPAGSGLSWDDFKNSDAYQYVFDEAMRGANSKYAARGLLKSDAAVKGVMDRGAGLSGQNYFNWANLNLAKTAADRGQFNQDRAYGADIWNNQQNRADNIFSTDRSFQAGRYDQDTANLFGVANIGQSAAAGTANAGNAYAQAQTANNNNTAATIGNSAIAGANNLTNMFGQGLQAYGMYKGGAF